MLFNSLNFAFFLPIVFCLYWYFQNKSFKIQNVILLIASYFFYSFWNWHFLFLLIFSTFLDYFTGLKIYDSQNDRTRKIWLCISVIVNLGFLAIFKYYNFFIESFSELISAFGLKAHYASLNVILPVGISFYTFHGLSYVIDTYNKKINPTKNIVQYSLFVSFFPLLVAGPIERATHLLPQVECPRKFDYLKAVDGLRQILWGLFKKIVIADSCAQYANLIFNDAQGYNGSTLLVGAIFFTFQIYGDFSGYSDIALGTARLFGFELLKNFNFPYFSRDIAEFWRRWHISLSSWFKDYLYIPLGGSKGSNWFRIRNIFIIFFVSGFWHGANWTFIFWGGLNALFILPSIILKTNRNNIDIVAKGKYLPTIKEFMQIMMTFFATVFAWIFFRAKDLTQAFYYLKGIFSESLLKIPQVKPPDVFVLIILFMLIEWMGRETNYGIEKFAFSKPTIIRWSFYFILIILIFLYSGREQEFIYFQF
jgi:alginate O-acetyltransferase complex protein AlgI